MRKLVSLTGMALTAATLFAAPAMAAAPEHGTAQSVEKVRVHVHNPVHVHRHVVAVRSPVHVHRH